MARPHRDEQAAIALGVVAALGFYAVLFTRGPSGAPRAARSAASGSASASASAATAGEPLRVPHAAPGGIVLDGELSDPGWKRDAWAGRFKTAEGARAFPNSEARVTWDERALYLGLYAADEDIKSTDHFDVTVTGPGGATKTLQLFARGAGADADGTVDDASDEDEEWNVEAALPLADLGAHEGDRLTLVISRCDTPRGSPRSCGGWSGAIVLAR
jgi:hypothetical protein